MIVLFEENEILFTGLGLGILKDAKLCTVKEELNDSFEVEMVYPITGQFYDKIKLNRIIFCKPNPYTEAQPFRIYSISKPINGQVTVNAFHISYDMNGYPVKPIDGKTIKDTLDKIQNGSIINHNFKLYTDKNDTKEFKTNGYFNMRALLLGSNESVLEKYDGEVYFDKFNVYLLKQRGSNRGAQVRYAKNLKDITHEISYDRLYNGVYPYYHQETTSQTTTTSQDGFQQVYIVGSKPYQDGWLSFTQDGEPYHPVDESPVQVATEGSFYQKVYCWNPTTQRYVEKIYNEVATLIDQVGNLLSSSDTPSWIYIDWSKLPKITCKAKVDGYFNPVTESDWAFHKDGDVIFENTITEVATNLMIYYSEVIPTSSTSETEETTSITHVELADKILYLDTDAAKEMKFDRILSLDLTREFEEAPTQEQLEVKAKEYIEKNKIGQYKYNTTVSFIDLSSTTEGASYEKMEVVELGDIVKVIYDDLGVNVDLRVISTQYNVLMNRYDKVELGEKPDKISGESVQNGDNISSLTNDVGYADITTVNKLIAKTVTADFIKALNAEFSKAQIEELTTARIKVSGLIEATQFELDQLIAKMLIADNAKIKETLEAGSIKVSGDITINKGEINIVSTSEDGSSIVFRVDRNGNLTANSVKITGGELNINDTFTVTPDGILSAQGAQISGDVQILSGSIEIGNKFKVTEDGTVTASGATISGDISADTGHIAGFTIESNRLESGNSSNKMVVSPGYSRTIDSIYKDWSFITGYNTINNQAKFKVANDGSVYAKELHVIGGDLNIGDNFIVDSSGKLTMKSGSITIKNGSYTKFNVTETGVVTAADMNITGGSITIKDIFNVVNFKVTNQGILTANGADITGSVTITSGSISIHNSDSTKVFSVSSEGDLNANSVTITGGSLHIQGSSAEFGVSADGKLTAVEAEILGRITATSGYIGTTEKGFTITENAIYNGFDGLTSDALSGGVYIGTDGIRVGQDSTRSKIYWTYVTIYKNQDQYLDISDSNYPNDNYEGGMFQFIYYSSTDDRIVKFTPVNSDWSPLYDAKTIEVKLPAEESSGSTEIARFSLTQSKYFTIRFEGGSAASMTIYGLSLVTLAGFVVNRYGDVIMRDATVKGSFQGDVTITSGSINIQNSGGTKVFSVSTDGELTATSANISGSVTITSGSINIHNSDNTKVFSVDQYGELSATGATISGTIIADSGSIGGLNISSDALYFGTNSQSSTTGGIYISKDGINVRSGGGCAGKIWANEISCYNLFSGTHPYVFWTSNGGVSIDYNIAVVCVTIANVPADSWGYYTIAGSGYLYHDIYEILYAYATIRKTQGSGLGGYNGMVFVDWSNAIINGNQTAIVYAGNDGGETHDIEVVVFGKVRRI